MQSYARPEERLKELHLELPPPPKPVAVYRPALLVGSLLYLAGHGPLRRDGTLITGKLGRELNVEQGKLAARQTGLAILSTVRNTLGSLDKVKRLVKTLGLVNCIPDFTDHPQVINGFSELMAEVFGKDAGIGVRSAVGASSLPADMAVEIECIFEVETT
ncbi:MAG: hypothetical protein C4297_10325 [Gemmataceae bacterium]